MQTRTIAMVTMIYIGMAVTGNSTTTLATGVFDNVATTGSGATPTPTATNTPLPTNTPSATNTPVSTNTPTPTNTPAPSPTPAPDVWIKRSSYSIAGQMVAFRVTGDPLSANNGLFYVLSDHLGSTSLLVNSSGGVVGGSTTRYLPFGGYRGTAPSQSITDRDFTGQKQNRELGLLYYQARFYVPGIGRFASADSLVPDPANPQAYNRYSYVENRPMIMIDPTGHCNVDPYDDYHDYDCMVEAQNLAKEYGISFELLAKYWKLGASTPEELGAIWQAFMSSITQLANPTPSLGDTLAQPETIPELMAMMGIAPDIGSISQTLFDLDPSSADCHNVCAASTGQTFDEFVGTANSLADIYYKLGDINGEMTLSRRTAVVYAFTRYEDSALPNSSGAVTYEGKHSALMVSFDINSPSNSIVVQVNGSVNASGVYFTRIKDTVYFQVYNYIGIPE